MHGTSHIHIGGKIRQHLVILESICATNMFIKSLSRLTYGTGYYPSNLNSSLLALFVTLFGTCLFETKLLFSLCSLDKIFWIPVLFFLCPSGTNPKTKSQKYPTKFKNILIPVSLHTLVFWLSHNFFPISMQVREELSQNNIMLIN